MKDFILFMYDDATDPVAANEGARWETYFSSLHASGQFDGGSSIGLGTRFRKNCPDQESGMGMSGFIRLRAEDLAHAKVFLAGNPIYQAGGTVEIRELPRDE
jgi:hypothetical protein